MGTTEFIIAARSKFVVLEAVKARVWCSALGTVVKGEVKLSSLSYAATGVAVKLAMDNNCIVVGVRFFDAAPKDRMVSHFLMSFQKTRNP